jgi:predicted Zn-dependent protease
MIENTLHQKSEEEKSPKSEVTKKASKSKVNSLKVTTEGSSLEELIKNQKKKKSYSATISIANYHYSRREYKEAITWAIEASKMDKSKARPWLIYANSKLSAGKIDIAKKALNIYLKNYQSKEAQALLKKLNAI